MLNKKHSDHTTLFNKNLIIILLLSLIFVLQGCVAKESNQQEQVRTDSQQNEQVESAPDDQIATPANDPSISPSQKTISLDALVEKEQQDLSSSFTIGMIGDVLFHEWLIEGGLQEDGSYDYPYIYE